MKHPSGIPHGAPPQATRRDTRRDTRGIALVATLGVVIVIGMVVTVLMAGTVGDLQQSRASVQISQARAAAEAGETYARMVMSRGAQDAMRAEIKPYVDAFMSRGGDPYKEWIVPEDQWRDDRLPARLAALLNGSHARMPSSVLSSAFPADVTISYAFDNFRGALRGRYEGAEAQLYMVDYTVVATGRVNGGVRRVEDRGVLRVPLGRPNLSQWLFLVDDASGNDAFFATGTVFDGPAHANENWGFWGRPEFREGASTASDGAWFWTLGGDACDNGSSKQFLKADSLPPCTVPDFGARGFQTNANRVELPTSIVPQRRAALGLNPRYDKNGDGVPEEPTNKEICEGLGFASCKKDFKLDNGVYLGNNQVQVTGGIYVEGDLDLLRMRASGDGKQIYEFVQGDTLTRMVLDYTADTTTVTSGKVDGDWKNDLQDGVVDPDANLAFEDAAEDLLVRVYVGVPNGPAPVEDATTASGGPTGQIYVEGKIERLYGPGRKGFVPPDPPDHPPPDAIRAALSMETQLHVSAIDEIDLYSDLVYECDPTVSDAVYLATRPRCRNGGDTVPTVLGVLSLEKDITITKETPDDLYLWGAFLAPKDGRGLAVEDFKGRGPQGKMRLFGALGQAEDKPRGKYNGRGELLSGYLETYNFDRRYSDSVLAPPNFPVMRVFDVLQLVPLELTYREY